ncbi:hypothetical protein ECG_08398 [Echinococcus granulosus]|uniref:Expressed conserved protein n=1 Tax=Echinococcus granulosus TaxID=6210 RepID=U6JAB9_ECHGR|nr:hypothetical protein EGR_09040 [Echinococcus granulosus]EUB56101.1 hypothetical protein EGR_09040 [Echinococcus granulosus]KAH9279279.1 hypothetical protein ECG_08398 [Echinococcus granulosus]CDS21035.1 expressed conserved protein [Echinococcus granulosus]
MWCVFGLTLLLVALSDSHKVPKPPKPLCEGQLESQKIQELVKTALNSTSPCSTLEKILNGTEQHVHGVKYHFQVQTTQSASCGEVFHGNPVSNLTIFLPSNGTTRPVYYLE